MKKFLFSLTAAAFALTSTAAGPTIIDGFKYNALMPSAVSVKGESYLVCENMLKIAIYDKHLQEKASFSFPEDEEFTVESWAEYRDEITGEWKELYNHTTTRSRTKASGMNLIFNGSEPSCLLATQTFFNNDSKFEYIVPQYEVREINFEGETQRGGGKIPTISSFEIKSHDGATIMTLTVPEEYRISDDYGEEGVESNVEGIIMDDKKYVKVIVSDYRSNTYAFLFYEIDGTSGVKAPAMVMEGEMKVHPTLPRRGETVTVDLGAAAQPGCSIAVTAVNGRNTLNLQAQNGATSVNIPTASLSAGMYIVTVTNGTSSTEAAKIIIR